MTESPCFIDQPFLRPRSLHLSRAPMVCGVTIVLAVLSVGAAGASGGTTTLVEDRDMRAAVAAHGTNFGYATAVSGDTLVIGQDDDGTVQGVGLVSIYERDLGGPDNWGLVKSVQASDGADGDFFGQNVAIDGDTLIVGAFGDADPTRSGAAYIFERDLGGTDNWGQRKKLRASTPVFGAEFGRAVAIDGDTLIVGEWRRSGAGAAWSAGAAYVFGRDEGGMDNWGEVKQLIASDPGVDHWFGYAVAVQGDVALIGARGHGGNGGFSGATYVFERDAGGAENWGETDTLTPADGAASDQFGYAVAMTADRAVITAPREGDATTRPGAAYVFELTTRGSGSGWGEVAKLEPADGSDNDRFGHSVALLGDRALIGAEEVDGGSEHEGAAYVYDRDFGGPDNWGEVAKLVSFAPESNDRLGNAVALHPSWAFVGSLGADDPPFNVTGAVFLYQVIVADVTISKSDGNTSVIPGQAIDYTVTVSNAGPNAVVQALVTDVLDAANLDVSGATWTCAPLAGAGVSTDCPVSGDATDLAAGVPVDLGVGEGVEMIVSVSLLPSASGSLVNTAAVDATGLIDPTSENNSATDTSAVLELDFGDAADPLFPTLLSSDGARHGITGLLLGASVDAEADGQESSGADGDDLDGTDDEDGIVFVSTVAGDPINVDVTASGDGLLDAWVDFNDDGDWADSAEQVFTSQPVTAGLNSLSFASPSDASITAVTTRFRLSSAGGLSASGAALNGEVEDHALSLVAETDLEVALSATPSIGFEGEPLFYIATVINHGVTDSTGATLTVDLPTGVTFIAATLSEPDCVESAGVVTCAVSPLADAAATDFVIEVVVDAGVGPDVVTATATIVATETDPNSVNDIDAIDTEVPLPADVIFRDGFESGDALGWSSVVP